MNFGQAIAALFKNYVNFRGRARRSEFWFAYLFISLVETAICWIPILNYLWAVGIAVAEVSLMVRRLHDIGKGWYWIFMYCIPFAGIVFMIMYNVTDSQGDNEWGPSPKYPGAPKYFNAPNNQPQYGQQYGQPQYNQAPYGQPQPQYTQPAPQYGQPAQPAQPQYTQPAPQYGQPAQPAQPQYAQPAPQYGQPAQPAQPQYTQPAPQYGQPAQPAQPQYAQPAPAVPEQYAEPVQPEIPVQPVESAQPAQPQNDADSFKAENFDF